MSDPFARIVYLSWPAGEISGGIKMAFAHVEALQAAGLKATVATADGKPPEWFETTAPPIDLSPIRQGEDVLVFPENHHALLAQFAPWPNRKIVFCQNWSMAVRGLGGCRDYGDFGVRQILCVGRYDADYCRLRFPAMPVDSVPVGIDLRRFGFPAEKKMQIAFAPQKRPREAAFIQDLFRARCPEFRSVPWVEIRGISEAHLAAVLKESAVYLCLGRFESCPLSILEAMAAGCIPAGFTGLGGRQFTSERNGFWAEEDDCIGCTERLAQAVRLAIEGGPRRSGLLEAAHTTASCYSRERMAKGVVEFWRRFSEGPKGPASIARSVDAVLGGGGGGAEK